jgi:ribonuclease R
MGDRVRIKVIAANLEKRQLDYEWILATTAEGDRVEISKPKRKKKKHGEE